MAMKSVVEMPGDNQTFDISPDAIDLNVVSGIEFGELESDDEDMVCDFALESPANGTSRGRSAEREAPRQRAQSIDSATALPSKQRLLWEAEQWREAAFEARAQAEALQEELVQLQEAILSSENEGTGAAASRYVARLAR